VNVERGNIFREKFSQSSIYFEVGKASLPPKVLQNTPRVDAWFVFAARRQQPRVPVSPCGLVAICHSASSQESHLSELPLSTPHRYPGQKNHSGWLVVSSVSVLVLKNQFISRNFDRWWAKIWTDYVSKRYCRFELFSQIRAGGYRNHKNTACLRPVPEPGSP
jgi:hypothetical protein